MTLTRRALLGTAPAAAASQGAFCSTDSAIVTESLALLDAQEHLRTGSEGDASVASFTRSALVQAGFRLRTQSINAPAFRTRRAALLWPQGELALEPLPLVRATGPEGFRAPLRLWRDSSDDAAMAGAIALVMLPHARHSQIMAAPTSTTLMRVAAAGARAIIFVTNGPTGETIFLNVPIERAALPPIPIALVGPKHAENAISAARAQTLADIIIDGASQIVRSENIWGEIRRGERFVVVSTPRTAWTPAVAERGPGLAAFLALAHWAPRALQRHSLLFVSTTAHEFDNAGSHSFLERAAPAPEQVALWVHLGAGFAARDFHEVGRFALAPLPSPDPQRFLVGADTVLPLLRSAFAGQPGIEVAYPASVGAAGELNEVLSRGYTPAFGLFAAHRFHHVMQDRLDKTDPAWIELTINALKTTITRALE